MFKGTESKVSVGVLNVRLEMYPPLSKTLSPEITNTQVSHILGLRGNLFFYQQGECSLCNYLCRCKELWVFECVFFPTRFKCSYLVFNYFVYVDYYFTWNFTMFIFIDYLYQNFKRCNK